MGGKDSEGTEALAAGAKERGPTLLRDLHSCSQFVTVR